MPQLRILVVGAGIAGLTAAISLAQDGHKVTLLESAPELAEMGAGIQMTPQAIKYLFKLGLESELRKQSIVPTDITVRHYEDGSVIGRIDVAGMEAQYDAPYIVIHRANLHHVLHRQAIGDGVVVNVNSRVQEYRFEAAEVLLWNDMVLKGDLVVAADGINSSARQQLLGDDNPGVQPTGFAAIRMMAEVSKIKQDPDLSTAIDLESNSSNFWVAPEVSCMTYLIKNATMLNIVLSHMDAVDTSDFTLEQYRELVDRLFGRFEPRVQRLFQLALPKIANWPVYAVPPLRNWIHPSGRFVLLGDAAHAMAFYLSMGVSLAVEDAVCLTAALRHVASADADGPDVPRLKKALESFEHVRKRRSKSVAEQSLRAGHNIHMGDGPEREVLYESISSSHHNEYWPAGQMTAGIDQTDSRPVYGISDKAIRDWCYGYDAEQDMMECLVKEDAG